MFRLLVIAQFLLVLHQVCGETFIQWIGTQDATDLSTSTKLAGLHEGIETLADDMPNLVLFLPDNTAWGKVPKFAKTFESDPSLRFDMILASGAEILVPDDSSPLQALEKYQQENGMLDSGYGTPYFYKNKELCLGTWQTDSYKKDPNQCADLSFAARLDDAVVFKISEVLLPEELVEYL